MKKSIRSMLALLLAVLTLASLGASACAEDPACPYTAEQYYEADENQTQVFTVQVSAGPYQDGAERTRDYMLSKGFDCFVYAADGGYRIMCGKFESKWDACRYRDLIRKETERKKAYVTDVRLPDTAIEDFKANYKQDPRVVGDVNYNGWESPTGAFVDMTGNKEETKVLYAVLYSSGINFQAAEKRRDELTEMGFDGYVAKIPGCYLVLAGAFEERDEALEYRAQIRESSGRWGTTIRQLELPASLLK